MPYICRVIARLPLLPEDRTSHQIFNTSHGQEHSGPAAGPRAQTHLSQKPTSACLKVLHVQNNKDDGEPDTAARRSTIQQHKGGDCSVGRRGCCRFCAQKGKVGRKKKRSLIHHSVCDRAALKEHNLSGGMKV